MNASLDRNSAFSLLEVVIVVAIMGILALIAMPRIGNMAANAEQEALLADLTEMRKALDFYAVEHDGNYPGSLVALARYTDGQGAMSSNKTSKYIYGKYLRAIPPCPVGPCKGATGWAAANANPPTVVSGSSSVGWLYHAATGGVWVNDINHLDK
jgi:prepilin-type N-terminal cleavage/methylation domain-containing protein